MKTLILKEARSLYTLALDEDLLAEGPVRLQRGDETLGILVSPQEYEAFRAWREGQQHGVEGQPADDAFRREVAAYERLLPELLDTHRGQVVAIHGGQVVEVGDSKREVVERAHERLGEVSLYVQRVTDELRVHKFPYFKVSH